MAIYSLITEPRVRYAAPVVTAEQSRLAVSVLAVSLIGPVAAVLGAITHLERQSTVEVVALKLSRTTVAHRCTVYTPHSLTTVNKLVRRDRPKFGFGFGFGAECHPKCGFGLHSASAEVVTGNFGLHSATFGFGRSQKYRLRSVFNGVTRSMFNARQTKVQVPSKSTHESYEGEFKC